MCSFSKSDVLLGHLDISLILSGLLIRLNGLVVILRGVLNRSLGLLVISRGILSRNLGLLIVLGVLGGGSSLSNSRTLSSFVGRLLHSTLAISSRSGCRFTLKRRGLALAAAGSSLLGAAGGGLALGIAGVLLGGVSGSLALTLGGCLLDGSSGLAGATFGVLEVLALDGAPRSAAAGDGGEAAKLGELGVVNLRICESALVIEIDCDGCDGDTKDEEEEGAEASDGSFWGKEMLVWGRDFWRYSRKRP